jgi:hypothetical protein
MTSDARPTLMTRVLDGLFGKAVTPEMRALHEAARPPRVVTDVLLALMLATFCLALIAALWSWGLLPFVESRISRWWALAALGANVLVRFGQEWVAKHYRRRAEAGEISKAAPPQ